MVAKFETGSSLNQTLNYNEKKVQRGVAELLTAVNYPLLHNNLSFEMKLNWLTHRASLNENVRANSVHISLNFAAADQLDNGQLAEIAEVYMNSIGFGDQPYLVYRHYDAGHLHTHIVSVKIGADGRRLETQNIGRNQSRKACVEIEKTYGLTRTNGTAQDQSYKLEPVNAQRVRYGKTETKRAISNVLRSVLDSYIFTSLPELNALLKQYNVAVDRGSETSRTYRNNGLLYHVLDENGKRIGIPIKASLFYMKPTLNTLQARFEKNTTLKEPLKRRVKNVIDRILLRHKSISLPELTKALEKEGIAIVLRQNEAGRIYGITYVDHKQKAVFNGSDLGKQYSANAIQERCGITPGQPKIKNKVREEMPGNGVTQSGHSADGALPSGPSVASLTDTLLQEEYTGDTLPFELKRNKKKKRKRLSNNQ